MEDDRPQDWQLPPAPASGQIGYYWAMPKFTVSTRFGTVDVEADTQPSTAEVEAYMSSQSNQQQAKDTNTAVVNANQPSLTNMVIGMGIEGLFSVGGTILGGLAGGAAGTAAAPGLGTLAGATKGAIAGGALGGATGSYLRQLWERSTGSDKPISGGQIVGSAVLGTIPGAVGAKTVAKSAGYVVPIVFRSAQGALTAASAETIEKAIDENRLPTWDEIKLPLAVGAVAGGTLGAVEKRYITSGNLIANPVAAQAAQASTGLGVGAYVYNSEREKGNTNALPTAVAYGLATYGGTHIPSIIANSGKQLVQGGKRVLGGPESIVGDPVVHRNYELQAAYKGSRADSADFNKLISDLVAKDPDPAKAAADVLSVMDGRMSSNNLSADLKQAMDTLYGLRAENAKNLVALYPNMSKTLAKRITDNGGDYTRIGYMAFNEKAKRGVDWDTPVARADFMKELADGFEAEAKKKKAPISRAQAEAYADNYMKEMVKDVSLIYSGGDIDKSMIGGLSSPLKKKKDLSSAARAWLGKVEDPGLIAEISLNAQDRLIIQAKYDRDLADFLLTSGIGTKADTSQMGDDFVLMVKGDTPVMHSPLAGIKVPRAWAEAHEELQSPHLFGDNSVMKAILSFSGFSKAMKTVGNLPEAFAPQMFGNLAFAASAGAVNPISLWTGLRKSAYSYGWRGGNMTTDQKLKQMQEFKRLRELNILRGGAEVEELRGLTQSATQTTRYKRWMDKASNAYGFPDTAVRYAIYNNFLEEIKQLGPEGAIFLSGKEGVKLTGTGLDQFERLAAALTSNQYQTYDKINRRFKQLSAAGAANAFGAFEYEVVRNFKNMLVHNKRLLELSLTATNPDTRKAAAKQFAKRAMSMSAVAGVTAGVAVAGNRMFGTSEQEEQAMRLISPSFDQYKTNIYKINEDGKSFTYAPINYLMPYANMMGTMLEAYKGGNPMPYLKTTFLGDDIGPLFTSATEAVTNTYYNTQVAITEPRDNVKLAERLVTRAFLPQFVVGTLARTEKAILGETNKLGTKYTLEDQLKRFGGYRANTMDILGSASVRIRDIAQPMGQELTGYKRILKGAYDETTEQYRGLNEEQVYNERNTRYLEAQRGLGDIYRSLKLLSERGGYGDNEIINSFRAAGVPNRIIAAAVFGYQVPMTRGIHESHSDIIDGIMSDPAKRSRAREIINGMAGSDKVMRKSLMESYQNHLIEEKRGVSNVTRLFAGMSVGDGERANNILQAMSTYVNAGSPEVANAFKRQLTRAGVVTPDVEIQIRQKLAGRP